MKTGHTECAQVICDILKRKGSCDAGVDLVICKSGVVSLAEGYGTPRIYVHS